MQGGVEAGGQQGLCGLHSPTLLTPSLAKEGAGQGDWPPEGDRGVWAWRSSEPRLLSPWFRVCPRQVPTSCGMGLAGRGPTGFLGWSLPQTWPGTFKGHRGTTWLSTASMAKSLRAKPGQQFVQTPLPQVHLLLTRGEPAGLSMTAPRAHGRKRAGYRCSDQSL